jgi:hypothetical protein
MLLISKIFESRLIARAPRLAIFGTLLAAACLAQKIAHPGPDGPPAAAPVPSSFLLVLAGMIGLLAWNWLRSRSRRDQTSRD